MRDSPITAAAPCKACGKAIMVEYQAAMNFQPHWSAFDCPHCGKPNVARFPGNIQKVSKQDQN